MKLRLWNYYWNASFPKAWCFSRSIFLSLITIIVIMIWSLCIHCHSHSFKITWTEKRINGFKEWWLTGFCHHGHMSLSRVFTGAACKAEHHTTWAGASASGTVALLVYLKQCWQYFHSDHVSIWMQLWCKETRNAAKWGDRELFIDMSCSLQANTKENCILFMWWMSLVLHIAPCNVEFPFWGSLIMRLRLCFG